MNRVLRHPRGHLRNWGALGLFAAVYLAALALVLLPGRVPAAFGEAAVTDLSR